MKLILLIIGIVLTVVAVLCALDKSVFYRITNPSYSTCGKCKMPWNIVDGHSTYYETSGSLEFGIFPLCEKCWGMMSIQERLPYYKELWSSWGASRPKWVAVEKAVLEGK